MHLIFKEGFPSSPRIFFLYFQFLHVANFFNRLGELFFSKKLDRSFMFAENNVYKTERTHRMSFAYVYKIKTGGTGVVWATVFNIVKSKMSNRKKKGQGRLIWTS